MRYNRVNLLFLCLLLAGQVNCSVDDSPTNLRLTDKAPYEPGWNDHVSIDGITWYFDKAYQVGLFANGDWWVAGDTVVIIRITPDFKDGQNGWEVNPIVKGGQGFSKDLTDFDPNLVPSLPYKAIPTSSIVKTVRAPDVSREYICRGCLKSAAVLTVVKKPIRDSTTFRPPYVGTNKKIYDTSSLQMELLPRNYSLVSKTPAISSFSEIKHLQLDHKNGATGCELHTTDGFMSDYGGYIGQRNGDITLRLLLNDNSEEKRQLLIAYVQYGIDLLYTIPLGYQYVEGGGHRPGDKIPRVFAAVMLGDEEMIDMLKNSVNLFHERLLLNVVNGKVLYGNDPDSIINLGRFSVFEKKYWEVVHSHVKTGARSGYKSYFDPYGYIDGGGLPGWDYQFVNTQPWKSSILAIKLMPELAKAWNDTVTKSYVERWVKQGIWTQPDPCAPADTNWSNYGITFGPDGKGGCIEDSDTSDGIGRFPSLHGKSADEGNYSSKFQKELWNMYYYNDK